MGRSVCKSDLNLSLTHTQAIEIYTIPVPTRVVNRIHLSFLLYLASNRPQKIFTCRGLQNLEAESRCSSQNPHLEDHGRSWSGTYGSLDLTILGFQVANEPPFWVHSWSLEPQNGRAVNEYQGPHIAA